MARAHRGYTVLELLLALSIVALLTGIVTPALISLNRLIQSQKNLYQDEVGIYQLQILIASNKVLEVGYDSIIYQSAKNECEISLVNGNVISQPGWLCYLYDVDDAYFSTVLGVIYLDYEREGKTYSFPIGYVE